MSELAPTLDVLTEQERSEALRWSRAEYLTVVLDEDFPGEREWIVLGHRDREGTHGVIVVGYIFDARKPLRKTLRSWVYKPVTARERRMSTYDWEGGDT